MSFEMDEIQARRLTPPGKRYIDSCVISTPVVKKDDQGEPQPQPRDGTTDAVIVGKYQYPHCDA